MPKAQRVLLAAASLLAGSSLIGLHEVQAQGVASHTLRDTASQSMPAGPGQSRLPLIDPSVFPVGGSVSAAGAPAPQGVPGASLSSLELEQGGGQRAPSAYGSLSWPYTNARVANTSAGKGNAIERTPVTGYPFRASGKLWMRFGSSWFVCTASLIKKGLLVSAAHCVHNYGTGTAGFADEVLFYPANVSNSFAETQPYGQYKAHRIYIPNQYRNGNDTCESGAVGIVCNNDLAVITLRPKKGVYPGTILGWYAYGWNGYSYVTSDQFGNQHVADITQLGYPAAWDSGYQMQRGNSFGKRVLGTGTNKKELINTQLGSAMTGGSSGGPWLVNFGTEPTVTGTATPGTAANRLVVVGTTSWGYTSTGPKVQGASWFGQNNEFPNANYGGHGAGNIGALVSTACSANPDHCAP